jgi:hypothetical protein
LTRPSSKKSADLSWNSKGQQNLDRLVRVSGDRCSDAVGFSLSTRRRCKWRRQAKRAGVMPRRPTIFEGMEATVGCSPYLPSFQISAASFQSLPIFSHTTTYLPVILRRRTLGLEVEGPDLAGRGGPEWLDIERCKFRIADLLRHAFPQCLDRGSALHHAGTGCSPPQSRPSGRTAAQ